jgi:hypothetical protein
MANLLYTTGKSRILSADIDLNAHTFKCGLLDDGHTPSAADGVWSDVSGDEISGTGYTAGGATMAGLTVGTTGTTAYWDATDVSWSSATFTARYAVVYDTSDSDRLICLLDFTANRSVVAGSLTIQWSTSGIIYC